MTIDARPHAYIATSLVAIYDTRTCLGGVFHVIGYVTFAIYVQILPREVFEQTADETNDPGIEKARGTSSTLFLLFLWLNAHDALCKKNANRTRHDGRSR